MSDPETSKLETSKLETSKLETSKLNWVWDFPLPFKMRLEHVKIMMDHLDQLPVKCTRPLPIAGEEEEEKNQELKGMHSITCRLSVINCFFIRVATGYIYAGTCRPPQIKIAVAKIEQWCESFLEQSPTKKQKHL